MLTPKSRLGPYEVVSLLGAGGMGEVFRARDTRLNRDVALKILPDVFASDLDRVARFTREAQTLAALNHPHIAQIYGVEIGADEGGGSGCRALVMELVEGEDLSERLSRGPLPIDEALPIARQIAEALEAAHEQGIIHRDLKPGNIKLRPDGTVKVLDFGLAKALDHAPVSGSQASPVQHSPTITTPAMTLQGVILGTAAYMSPEQAKGRLADQRSDVWAFGCVLFEMLTAKRAFEGEDVSDTLAAVLRGDPPYAALPADTPPAVTTLIKRCLERDRRRRVSSASTALFVIDEASAVGAAAQQRARPDDGTIRSQVQAAVSDARRTLIRKRFVPVVAALLLLAVTASIVTWRFRPTGSTLVTRFTLPVAQTGLVTGGLGRSVIAVSNDGATLAYAANRELLLRPVSDFAARAVPTTDAVGAGLIHSLVFSPDDQSLAFFATISGTVKRISLSGGAAITVCAARQPWGMTWHETGLIIAQGADGIVRCAANGGAPEQLVTVSADEIAQGPQIIAADTLLFTLAKPSDGAEMWDKAEIVVQSLASGARKTILRGTDARYVPTGHLLYAVSGVVFAIPFDARRQEVSGAAVPVIEGVRRSVGNTGTAHFVTSPTGSLIYFAGPVGSTVATWAVAVADRMGAPTRLPVQPGPYSHVRASRDGTYLAVGSDDNREAIVWIHRLDGNSAMRRLTLTGRNRFPVWLPDGQRVAFQSDREGDAGIFVQRIDGTGAAERLTKAAPGETHIPDAWSPDGRHMLFAVRKGADYSLAMFSVADKQVTPVNGVQSREPTGAVFSPDGRWIAYASNPGDGGVRSANRGIFLQPFPPTGAIYQAPSDIFDFHPAWNPKGMELVYVPSATSGDLAVINVKTDSGVAFGSATKFPALLTAQRVSSVGRVWDILPDGRFVGLVNAAGSETSPNTSELRVVINWFEELKARVPTH